MSEPIGDKNYIENLLNALSVPDALGTFSNIDKCIGQLLDCSSEDFLTLNNHFKNYHKESKVISQNVSNIIQILTDKKINESFGDIKKFCDSFSNLTNLFSQNIELLDVEIKKSINKLEHLKITYNNYKQNLGSIKILLANIITEEISGQNEQLKNKKADVEEKIESIKSHILSTDDLIEGYTNIAQESYLLLSKVKTENYQQLQKLNDNIEISFNLFNKKYTEASLLFPALQQITEKNSTNIAKIVTNLQYHDIIRQKIEHIQKTHKDIIEDLSSYNNDDQSQALLHNKAKTFLKIRDVAGLQAAQLLHANKQYQMAIEEIGNNLEEIGNEMIIISCNCDNLVGKSTQTKDFYLNNIVELLNSALKYNNKLSDVINTIKDKTELLSVKNEMYINEYNEITLDKEAIKTILYEISNIIESQPSFTNERLTNNQLKSLVKETDSHEKHIGEIHNELTTKVEIMVNPKNSFSAEKNILNNLNELSSTIPNLIELVKQSIQNIDELLYSNSSISINVSDNIKNSLKKIKYYDLFEKTCEKIVEDLNSVNLKLNYGTTEGDPSRSENLKHLKDRYTMESEHLIHDQLTKSFNNKDLNQEKTDESTNLTNENSEADDDNLELF